ENARYSTSILVRTRTTLARKGPGRAAPGRGRTLPDSGWLGHNRVNHDDRHFLARRPRIAAPCAAPGRRSPSMSPEQALSGLRDTTVAAAAKRTALEIHGGRSKHFLGNEPRGEPLDVRGFAGIVSYEPTELVVTARCGTPLADLEAALAERGQMLAFEPPHFGPGATV